MMAEQDDQIDSVLPMCDNPKPREIAKEAVERWRQEKITKEQNTKPLPVDDIQRRKQQMLEDLIGKK